MDFTGRFLQQAGATPTATAVTDDCSELSYARLAALSGSLSARLHAMGLPAGRAAAVLVPRTTDIVVCALAAMRAGGVYMPMDPAYPSDRLAYMLENSSAFAVLTTRAMWASKALDATSAQVVFVDELEDDGAVFDAPHAPEDPAYLLYTSGTTGRPKGVLHTHRSLLAMSEQWEEARFDSTGVVAGFTFIASAFMMFPPLIVGGCVNIVPDRAKSDMVSLQAYVTRRDIHQLFLPASLAASMAEEYALDGVTIFSAGEKLRNFRRLGGCKVINAYGSTEGVVVLAAAASGDEIDIPLGLPCKGITVRIVDDSLADVAEGEIGELIYSGDIMAERYLGLDEQTAAKWIEADGRRWYRTGDRMKVDSVGLYHYVGRADNMVKIRGFRVETGEVENAIVNLEPRIVDVVVVLRTLHGIDHLCCYYTSSETIDVDALKSLIQGRLAEYMIPDIWVALDSFPRNPNGKIMRSALPEPQQHLEALSALYSEVELRVEEAARTVLGLDTPIDIDESFLDLGGDSISAMKLSAMLAEQGIRVTGSQILRLKLLRKIAEEASVAYERLWTPEQYTQVKYRFSLWGEKILKVLPLTTGQDDMLYSTLIFPDSCDNRSIYTLDTESNVDADELKAAVDAAARDNEGLRAAVVYHGVSVFQQVITDRAIPSRCVDLRAEGDPMAGVARIFERMQREPVDLEQSPAMKVVFARTGDSKGVLIIKVLHVSLGMAGVRRAISGIVGCLAASHPEDASLDAWKDILSAAAQEDSESSGGPSKTAGILGKMSGEHEEIAVFSDHPGLKKIVFVHTGNTGSDAYYQLADKIGDKCSFSVIEPFNLYHSDEAVDGIHDIAAKYVEILRRHQPEGPYFLGGWCYGGVVAQEMACQLEAAGEKVEHLVMLDSHATVDPVSRELFKSMNSFNNREYFESSPLFADLRAQGLLESVIVNSKRVARDLVLHEPSVFHGPVTYFKPKVTPSGLSGDSLRYWQEMMEHKAGGYENFCTDLTVIRTPHEHDLMMDEASLAIIVPELIKLINEAN